MLNGSNSVMTHVEDALSSMLSKGLSLDKQLLAASKKILLQKIEFQPAQRTSSLFPLQKLRAKYTPLNASDSDDRQKTVVQSDAARGCGVGQSEDGITVPTRILCPPDTICFDWPESSRVGAGLANLGNTCFLNSTLQCLTHTVPLVNYLRSSAHHKHCRVTGLCMMCELHKHISHCLGAGAGAGGGGGGSSIVKPLSILQKLRLIARHMRWGRQEDAHEFLRYVVDALQRAALVGVTNIDQRSKETTFVHQIFGGYLRSQVMCLRCNERSNTFDPFLDLCMDVRHVASIEMALQRFVQPELLSKENAYLCSRCKGKVTARKAFTVHRAPNVLTIQLKRYGAHGSKVTRHISFSERLDLRPYMSPTTKMSSSSVGYRLYAVLVHNGCTVNSGHYYCYVRSSPAGTWHCMNDSSVHPTSIQRILQAEAYILFYMRSQPTSSTSSYNLQASQLKSVDGKCAESSSSSSAGATKSPAAATTTSVVTEKFSDQTTSKLKPFAHLNGLAISPSPRPNMPSIISEHGCQKTDIRRKSDSALLSTKCFDVQSSAACFTTVNGRLPPQSLSVSECKTHSDDEVPSSYSAHSGSGSKKRLESNEEDHLPRKTQAAAAAEESHGSGKIVSRHKEHVQSNSDSALSTTPGVEHSVSKWNCCLNPRRKEQLQAFSSSSKMHGVVGSTLHHKSDGRSDNVQEYKKKLSGAKRSSVSSTTKWHVMRHSDDGILPRGSHTVHATTPWHVEDVVSKCDVRVAETHDSVSLAVHRHDMSAVSKQAVYGGHEHVMIDSSESRDNTRHKDSASARQNVNCCIQQWDEILPNSYKTSGLKLSESRGSSKRPVWDGLFSKQQHNVADELQASAVGYGATVRSWDGGESLLDKEHSADKAHELKRRMSEMYEDELDEGRVKKMKKRRVSDVRSSLQTGNRFQQFQNFTNMEKEAKQTGILSWKSRPSVEDS